MRKSNALNIVGYSNFEEVRNKWFTDISRATMFLDGYKIDTIHLSVAIYTPSDIDDLINLLEVSKESLHTQGQNHGSNEINL